MPNHAISSFDVTSWDETAYHETETGPKLTRAVVGKTFSGDLEGASTAELLMCRANAAAAIKGAGYVAIEIIDGQLDGRKGTFVLQHGGVMVGAVPQNTFAYILPGSGTENLEGITGEAEIAVDKEGNHSLALSYEIAE